MPAARLFPSMTRYHLALGILLVACDASTPAAQDGAVADSAVPSDGSLTDASITVDASALVWREANLTNYTSYPDPESDECVLYNGCMWAGMFAALDGVQSEEWVMSHNIAAVHSDDFPELELKTLRLRQGNKTIDVVVYDMCSDTDCSGCCTTNASENGLDFLIDIESYTMQRFGTGSGIVEWACLDC